MSLSLRIALLAALLWPCAQHAAAQNKSDIIAGYLESGKLAQGRKAVEAALTTEPQSNALRFQLGLVQFFDALEKLEQDWHRFGLHDSVFGEMIPFLRLPVPPNPHPERVTNETGRKVIADFLVRLNEVADTLAKVGDDAEMKVSLRPGLVRLDFDGDGIASEDEVMWKVIQRLIPGARFQPNDAAGFLLKLDLGDVRWLQGYCHLLCALGDVMLAYDTEKLFAHTAPLFFANADTPFDFLRRNPRPEGGHDLFRDDRIFDAIAFIHLLSFPVKEPQRMQSALHHLEAVTKLSRASWKAILAETDDDHEWIPGPKQTSVFGPNQVTPELIDGWLKFLDEMDDILAGRKLIPFWRDADGRGVNLRRVFTEPTALDLVLWIQGTGASPYLEKGQVTSPEFWNTTDRIFKGQFLFFALWFN